MHDMPKKIYTSEVFPFQNRPDGKNLEMTSYVRADIVCELVNALNGFLSLPQDAGMIDDASYTEARFVAGQALASLNDATVEAIQQEDAKWKS